MPYRHPPIIVDTTVGNRLSSSGLSETLNVSTKSYSADLLSEDALVELKIMNLHLALLRDDSIVEDDIRDLGVQ